LHAEMLRERPKWFVGFSDATGLHATWQRAGLVSVHGPNLTTLDEWSEEARRALFACLAGKACPALTGTLFQGGEPVSGPLVGGNISVLASLVGTPFLPPLDETIVLLEDVDERPYRIDRYLTQLRQAGAFRHVAGFVLGQLTRCEGRGWDAGVSAEAVLVDALADLDVPILGRVALGHEPTARPALLGATVTLQGTEGGEGHVVFDESDTG
jgi:muramoyltetrapeptide carboxypeptidase